MKSINDEPMLTQMLRELTSMNTSEIISDQVLMWLKRREGKRSQMAMSEV